MADKKKILVTGASGYIASRMLSTFRERYELVLLDVKTTNRAEWARPLTGFRSRT